MTRNRNLHRPPMPSGPAPSSQITQQRPGPARSVVNPGAMRQLAPDIQNMQQLLREEQSGNFGVFYPDGRPDIRQVRNLDRSMVAHFQDPRVGLPNPSAEAPFDRTEPLDRVAKNQAFGFQVQPDRLIDLPPGDAGAGKSVYRRGHFFARLDDPANNTVAGNPFDKAIGMATYVSTDCRPRFWHVSFFGIGIQRTVNREFVQPLTDNQILSDQLLPTITGATASPDFIPAITQLQGRVMVFDESGQRFYDVDILGNRSFDVYAWGVTFVLGPANAATVPDQSFYQVNPGTGGNLPQTALAGLVEDSIIGVRIVPIVSNSTQNPENRTITVLTNNVDDTRVPIPPGTRKVQIISHESALVAAAYSIRFDAGNDGTFIGNANMGFIDINAGESKSDIILVPNAAQIVFSPGALAPAVAGWSLIFTVESQ